MASKKQIYTIFACDAWQSKDSTRLMMVTTSVRRLKSFIAKQIEDEVFEYGDDDRLPPKKEAALFRKDFEEEEQRTINDRLRYGFYDYTYDGEEI